MINRALEGFLVATYGPAVWAEVRSVARLPYDGFEAMHRYEHAVTVACFAAAADVLDKNPNALLEDIGTFLITEPKLDPLRRLLRFGGGSFSDFLLSLEELPDRARLAIPELEVPEITIHAKGNGHYMLEALWPLPGIGPLLLGALRAMADDYGALAFVELAGIEEGAERLRIQVFDSAFNQGKAFSLGQGVA